MAYTAPGQLGLQNLNPTPQKSKKKKKVEEEEIMTQASLKVTRPGCIYDSWPLYIQLNQSKVNAMGGLDLGNCEDLPGLMFM